MVREYNFSVDSNLKKIEEERKSQKTFVEPSAEDGALVNYIGNY